jgi:elongation factor Ts
VTIREKVGEQNGIIGEKIELGRYERIEGALVLTYNHSNNKRSVLVALNMPARRSRPQPRHANRSHEPGFREQRRRRSENRGKRNRDRQRTGPQRRQAEDMLEKIAMGRLNKFFQENTLLSQKYVKNNEQTVRSVPQSLQQRPDGLPASNTLPSDL